MRKVFVPALVVIATQLLACDQKAAKTAPQNDVASQVKEPVAASAPTEPVVTAPPEAATADAAIIAAPIEPAKVRTPAAPAEIKRTQVCCRALERLGQRGGQETVQIGAFAGTCDELVIAMEGGYELPALDHEDSELLHDILSKIKISADCKRILSKLER